MKALTPSLNGTIEDAAAFFCVTPQTIREWSNNTTEHDQLISPTKIGRNVSYSEDTIVACYLLVTKFATVEEKRASESGGARKLWREHLGVRTGTHAVQALESRVLNLESRLEQLEGARRAA